MAVNNKRKYQINVVDQEDLRVVQSSVLKDLSEALMNSFGPYGSNTCIKKLDALPVYTKDGFTILKHIAFNGVIEQSIKDDIESITKNVATTIGDGTTSAVILSQYIFEGLIALLKEDKDNRILPSTIIRVLNRLSNNISGIIRASAEPATLELLEDIAYISSNGSNSITELVMGIYRECGMNVFIDVSPSLTTETSIKYFDGMTMNTGFSDTVFVTDKRNNTVTVDNPEVYFFEDPVDNKEMAALFDAIISRNIVTPFNNNEMAAIKPTVIVCPHLSRDMSSNLDRIVSWQSQLPAGNKLPFLLIVDTHQRSEIQDIYRMCGAKPIRKYIDREMYDADVEKGIAPTPFTIQEFAGKCDQVVAHSNRSKFINPCKMKDENGNYTDEYKNLLDALEAELSQRQADGDVAVGVLKRRINSLKGNLVEISVGGITVADRDSSRHLVEDVVLNCRSAAQYGVGYGANFNGIIAIDQYIKEKRAEDAIEEKLLDILYGAYKQLVELLYSTDSSIDDTGKVVEESIKHGQPYNLRKHEYSGVRSSIESDCTILSSVAKIIGIMVTCNQFVVPTPQHNVYSDLKEMDI